jgi:hypothetical protein
VPPDPNDIDDIINRLAAGEKLFDGKPKPAKPDDIDDIINRLAAGEKLFDGKPKSTLAQPPTPKSTLAQPPTPKPKRVLRTRSRHHVPPRLDAQKLSKQEVHPAFASFGTPVIQGGPGGVPPLHQVALKEGRAYIDPKDGKLKYKAPRNLQEAKKGGLITQRFSDIKPWYTGGTDPIEGATDVVDLPRSIGKRPSSKGKEPFAYIPWVGMYEKEGDPETFVGQVVSIDTKHGTVRVRVPDQPLNPDDPLELWHPGHKRKSEYDRVYWDAVRQAIIENNKRLKSVRPGMRPMNMAEYKSKLKPSLGEQVAMAPGGLALGAVQAVMPREMVESIPAPWQPDPYRTGASGRVYDIVRTVSETPREVVEAIPGAAKAVAKKAVDIAKGLPSAIEDMGKAGFGSGRVTDPGEWLPGLIWSAGKEAYEAQKSLKPAVLGHDEGPQKRHPSRDAIPQEQRIIEGERNPLWDRRWEFAPRDPGKAFGSAWGEVKALTQAPLHIFLAASDPKPTKDKVQAFGDILEHVFLGSADTLAHVIAHGPGEKLQEQPIMTMAELALFPQMLSGFSRMAAARYHKKLVKAGALATDTVYDAARKFLPKAEEAELMELVLKRGEAVPVTAAVEQAKRVKARVGDTAAKLAEEQKALGLELPKLKQKMLESESGIAEKLLDPTDIAALKQAKAVEARAAGKTDPTVGSPPGTGRFLREWSEWLEPQVPPAKLRQQALEWVAAQPTANTVNKLENYLAAARNKMLKLPKEAWESFQELAIARAKGMATRHNVMAPARAERLAKKTMYDVGRGPTGAPVDHAAKAARLSQLKEARATVTAEMKAISKGEKRAAPGAMDEAIRELESMAGSVDTATWQQHMGIFKKAVGNQKVLREQFKRATKKVEELDGLIEKMKGARVTKTREVLRTFDTAGRLLPDYKGLVARRDAWRKTASALEKVALWGDPVLAPFGALGVARDIFLKRVGTSDKGLLALWALRNRNKTAAQREWIEANRIKEAEISDWLFDVTDRYKKIPKEHRVTVLEGLEMQSVTGDLVLKDYISRDLSKPAGQRFSLLEGKPEFPNRLRRWVEVNNEHDVLIDVAMKLTEDAKGATLAPMGPKGAKSYKGLQDVYSPATFKPGDLSAAQLRRMVDKIGKEDAAIALERGAGGALPHTAVTGGRLWRAIQELATEKGTVRRAMDELKKGTEPSKHASTRPYQVGGESTITKGMKDVPFHEQVEKYGRSSELHDAVYLGLFGAYRDVRTAKMWERLVKENKVASAVEVSAPVDAPRMGWVRMKNSRTGDAKSPRYGHGVPDEFWVHPDVAADIAGQAHLMAKLMSPTVLGFMRRLVQKWKVVKTAGNPASHVTNMVGNMLVLAPMAGLSPFNPANLAYYQEAARQMLLGNKSKFWREFVKDGGLGPGGEGALRRSDTIRLSNQGYAAHMDGAVTRALRVAKGNPATAGAEMIWETLKYAYDSIDTMKSPVKAFKEGRALKPEFRLRDVEYGKKMGELLTKGTRPLADAAQAAYAAGDTFWRFASYLKDAHPELAGKLGKLERTITRRAKMSGVEAAQKARDAFAAYEKLSGFVRANSISLIGVPFLSFTAAMVPEFIKWLKTNPAKALIWQEIHERVTDMHRLAMGVPDVAVDGAQLLLGGYDECTMSAMGDIFGGQYRDERGAMTFIDTGKYHPFSAVLPRKEEASGETFLGAMGNVGKRLFLSGSPNLVSYEAEVHGYSPHYSRQLYDRDESPESKREIKSGVHARTWGPSVTFGLAKALGVPQHLLGYGDQRVALAQAGLPRLGQRDAEDVSLARLAAYGGVRRKTVSGGLQGAETLQKMVNRMESLENRISKKVKLFVERRSPSLATRQHLARELNHIYGLLVKQVDDLAKARNAFMYREIEKGEAEAAIGSSVLPTRSDMISDILDNAEQRRAAYRSGRQERLEEDIRKRKETIQ